MLDMEYFYFYMMAQPFSSFCEYTSKLLMQEFHDSRMASVMSFLTSVPRAAQLLDKEPGHILLVNSLEHEFKHYLQQVHRHAYRQDRR